jgi:hypothetical protein
MKKQLFAGLIAAVAAFAALILVPFYQIAGAAVIILAAVAMGALSFI